MNATSYAISSDSPSPRRAPSQMTLRDPFNLQFVIGRARRPEIANCKLQIANCKLEDGRFAHRVPALPAVVPCPSVNLQFAICNLQFAILLDQGVLSGREKCP